MTKKNTTKKKTRKDSSAVAAETKPEMIPLIPNIVLPEGEVLLDLKEICGGNENVALFFVAYLQNGMNSTKAYMILHPDVTRESASVLGARQLGKVRRSAILDAMQIGVQQYIEQIKEGMGAMITDTVTTKTKKKKGRGYDIDTVVVKKPDWSVRTAYHSKLGVLLGLEGKTAPNVAVQVNQNNNTIESLPDDDLDSYLNR